MSAAGAVAVAALAGGSLYLYAAYQRSPGRLALGQGAGTPVATTPAEPTSAENPCTSAAGTAGGIWVIEPGSQVGYRAREKFGEVESPHEAVARTKDVTGFVVIQQASSASTMSSGCVAADVRTLVSIDQLPPPLPDATGRDLHYGEMLDTVHHPYVVFRPEPIQLPSTLTSGEMASVALAGQLEIRGTVTLTDLDDAELDLGAIRLLFHGAVDGTSERRVVRSEFEVPMTSCQSALDAVPKGIVPKLQGMKVAGSFAIRSTDFGVEMPKSLPTVDPNLTLEFLVRLTPAA